MTLQSTFLESASHFTSDRELAKSLWEEVTEFYSEKGRYYHNLKHLEQMWTELEATPLQNRDAVIFALAYHDIIYKPHRSDNEEASAELAERRLRLLNVPPDIIAKCRNLILSTKKHEVSDDSDTNTFTDADLSILGSHRENYIRYSQAIRQEYKMVPDLIYKPGRKKVLRHFLAMNRIFKTEYFHSKYEQQARANIEWEISQLTQ